MKLKPANISAICRRWTALVLFVVALMSGALLSAGVDKERDRTAAQSVANTGQLVTKTDLAEAKSELKAEIAQLRNDLILLGAGMAGAIVLTMLAGFHLLWRRISELAERLPHAA